MGIGFNLMDEIFSRMLHLGHLPRRFPSGLPIDTIGYLPHKREWIRHQFQSFNFSFILSGGGEYWVGGRCWPVEAPCVITQSPWARVEYGPAGRWESWEELFLIYRRDRIPSLERLGLIHRRRPVWAIKDVGAIRARLLEWKRLGARGQEEGFADRIDRWGEMMVIESILGESAEASTQVEKAVQAIRDHVASHVLEDHDFVGLAKREGLSEATFRRYWARLVGPPPARYAMRLKIDEACRMLVETRLGIGEIADRLGFVDPLYFSRRFRQMTGHSAIEYRRNHASPLSLLS